MVLRFLPVIVIVGLILYVILLNKSAQKKDPKFITMPLPGNRKAVSMPPFGVYIEKDVENDEKVIKHEKCHWKQYQDKGLIDYYKEYFSLNSKYDYEDNPMEKECFIAEMA